MSLTPSQKRSYTDYADLVIDDRFVVYIDLRDFSWEVLDLESLEAPKIWDAPNPKLIADGGASDNASAERYAKGKIARYKHSLQNDN